MDIINMVISASIMILVGIIIRLLWINRVPSKTFVFIWLLASIRLLIPFSIPINLNLLHSFNVTGSASEGPSYILIAQWEQVSQHVVQTASYASQSVDYRYWIVGIWALGAIISALYFIVSHYRFRKEVGDSLPVENEFALDWLSRQKTIRTIEIQCSHKIKSPLTYGVLRPVILMPKNMNWQNEKGIKHILAHEYAHVKQFDYLLKIFFAMVLCVYWFNPLVWCMYVFANRDIELSCDEKVLKIVGHKSKPAYALTLIEMAENKNRFACVYSSFSKNAIEERIKVMKNMNKKSFAAVISVIIILAGGVMASAQSPQPTPDTQQISSQPAYVMPMVIDEPLADEPFAADYTRNEESEERISTLEEFGFELLEETVVVMSYDEFRAYFEDTLANLTQRYNNIHTYACEPFDQTFEQFKKNFITRNRVILDALSGGNYYHSITQAIACPDNSEFVLALYRSTVKTPGGVEIPLNW